MADRVGGDVKEIGPLDVVLLAAAAIEDEGQEAWDNSDPNDDAATACAAEYLKVCKEAAEGLRKTIERLERRVQRHLAGPCKGH